MALQHQPEISHLLRRSDLSEQIAFTSAAQWAGSTGFEDNALGSGTAPRKTFLTAQTSTFVARLTVTSWRRNPEAMQPRWRYIWLHFAREREGRGSKTSRRRWNSQSRRIQLSSSSPPSWWNFPLGVSGKVASRWRWPCRGQIVARETLRRTKAK